MEERSLRVYQQKTFFSKLGTTLSKILVPTRVGFNSIMISVKRNNLLKAYEGYIEFDGEVRDKKDYNDKLIDVKEKQLQAEILQIRDGNPYNDEIVNV